MALFNLAQSPESEVHAPFLAELLNVSVGGAPDPLPLLLAAAMGYLTALLFAAPSSGNLHPDSPPQPVISIIMGSRW